jgi:hypothetical protein
LNIQLYANGNADATNFIIIAISRKDAVMDKVSKQPMTHTSTHTQSNQSSITIQTMTNDTLLHSGKRHLMKMRTRLRVAVYWWLLTNVNFRRSDGPCVLV